MGFKHKLKKLMGQSVTDDSGADRENNKHIVAAGEEIKPVVSAGNVHDALSSPVEQKSVVSKAVPNSSGKDKDQTKQSRQVGSKWEHKHNDLDWHSMSIPHPVPPNVQAEKEVPSEPAAPLRAHQPQPPDQGQDGNKSISKQDILCKFVVQRGQRIGETISIDGGHLVFKHGAENLYIPMSSISGFTDEDVEIGDFNRDEALKLGEEWHQRTTDTLKFDGNGMLIND
ncbi:MAG: hypothetical protein K8R06_04900 [Methanosarcinales archaeon]|nr:hypothetical protein [Methanosarcinales archaeon]